MLRSIFIGGAIVGLLGLGLVDLGHQHWHTGVAGVLLAIANYLLLT